MHKELHMKKYEESKRIEWIACFFLLYSPEMFGVCMHCIVMRQVHIQKQ